MQRISQNTPVKQYSLFATRRSIAIEASPSVIWRFISDPSTYDSWADFKLTGGLIFENSQVYVRQRDGSNNEQASRRLKVTKLIEPTLLEFRRPYWPCQSYISFKLDQLDENETLVTYERHNATLLIWGVIFAYTALINSFLFTVQDDDGAPLPTFPFYIFNSIMIFQFIIVWIFYRSVGAKIEGSLNNLNHLVCTTTAASVSAPAIELAQTVVQSFDIENPIQKI